MGEARRRGTFEERKIQAIKRNKFNADHLEALKINRDIEEFKQREIQIENGTYKPPKKRRMSPLLKGLIVSQVVACALSRNKNLY